MQKLTFGDKLAVAGEAFFLLFKELSFGQCLVLQLIVAVIVWIAVQGGTLLAGALPTWALALGSAGFATILLATFRMGLARFGMIAIGMLATMLISTGSASVVVQDAAARPFGSFPSLNDLIYYYAWLMAGIGFGGGLVSTWAYVAWARERSATKKEGHA